MVGRAAGIMQLIHAPEEIMSRGILREDIPEKYP